MVLLREWILQTWWMAEAMAPWLLFGFAVSGLLHSFLPMGWIKRHLAREGAGSVIKAALVGTPLPLCSCGVIPVANWLRKEGASKGATMSFLVSTPETGLDSILATMAVMGGVFAGVRPVVAMVSGVAVGLLVSRLQNTKTAAPGSYAPISDCHDDSCCDDDHDTGDMPSQLRVRAKSLWGRLREAFDYGFVELMADISRWLILGLVVGGAISAFLPNDLLARAGSWGHVASYVLMLLIGIPLYVCATGSIPIAAAMMAKGVSPGAALVFLIAGPATNVATIAFVAGSFGRKVLAIYLTGIAGFAVLAGLAIDYWAWDTVRSQAASQCHNPMAETPWWAVVSAVVLFALLLPHVWKSLRKTLQKAIPAKEKKMNQKTYHIPSISCGNCVRHVEKAAKAVPGVTAVSVDLPTKKLSVEGAFEESALRAQLAEDGYPIDP